MEAAYLLGYLIGAASTIIIAVILYSRGGDHDNTKDDN